MRISTSPTLAVDIGNSRIHVGLVDTGRRQCLRRIDLPLSGIRGRLPEVLDKVVSAGPQGKLSGLRAVIAGEGNSAAAKVRALLKDVGIDNVANLTWHKRLPVRFHYRKPNLLGADRIADALYAATAYPGRNAIIIDVGTAVTVDALTRESEFIGGVIFPGPATQLRSLHEAANALPLLTLTDEITSLPGTSTEECIRSGVVHCIAGGLDHLVRQYRLLLGGRCTILSTGGGWDAVKNHVGFNGIEVPDMTLIGTAMYHDT